MREVLAAIEEAADAGEPAAVATVIATRKSAPKPVGSKLVVTASGKLVGSVSGGCVEADLAERAQEVLAGAPARVVSYGIAESDAWAVGLACGGEVDVFLERVDPELWRDVAAAVEAEERAVLTTDLETGEKRLERGGDGTTGIDDHTFTEVLEPPLRLVVFGATELAEHLAAFGRQLGWRTTVVDPRAGLATTDRLPSADEIVVAWPDEAAGLIDDRTAVVSVTHEERLDVPALATALRAGALYIGALGATRVQERRREALAEQGFTQDDLDRISGPAGLSLGGRLPAQIALAIAAEIVSVVAAPRPAVTPATG